MELEDVLRLITEAWPARYERGRITHVHQNSVKLSSGQTVHLRVMVQTIEDAPQTPDPWQG